MPVLVMHFVPEPAIDLQHAPAIVADDSGGDSEYYYNSRQAEACLPLQEIQKTQIHIHIVMYFAQKYFHW